MWIYEKRLQYPVNITKTDAGIAKIIASQYGGPDCNTLQIAGNPYKMGVPVLLLMPITQRIMGQMEVEIMIQDGHQILQMMHGL